MARGSTKRSCTITLQYQIRNQIAGVPGATVPPPYGGKYRQLMVYVDPLKLQAHELSPMDVVRAMNESNLILPAGDVRLGALDYNIYTNAQVANAEALNQIPLKTEGEKSVFLSDVGKAVDGSYLQYNIVRVNGQKSVYAPILKQGGDTNTIVVVNGIKKAITMLRDIPAQMHAHVVFDQSLFVKQAISTVLREGGIGLFLTAVMILLFLGSMRATAAVFLSIPLSVMITFFILHSADKTINSMVLSGLALAFSRLIDDSVVVIENIYRHIELGEDPKVAAVKGANEVALAVLAIMLVAVVVFFPVTLLFGVSKYLFSALALAVVLALCASYFDAVTVVPLFCAYFLKAHEHNPETADGGPAKKSWGARFHAGFNAKFEKMLNVYEKYVQKTLDRPREALVLFVVIFLLSFLLVPFIGVSFFPRSDAGQFVINVKAPTGTRIEVTNDYIKQVEDIVHQVVKPDDLNTVVSNIGVMADLSALFTPNSGMHTAFVQVGLKEDHHESSFVYMNEVRRRIAAQLPQLRTYFQSGGLVDAVLNQGMPAPIDVQVSGMDLKTDDRIAQELARQIRASKGVSDVYIPQDMDYPALEVNVNRDRAAELGLSPKEVIDNLITALTSDVMIAPSYWVDPKNGNNYFVTVQYPENQVKSIEDLKAMPLRSPKLKMPTYLNQVADVVPILTPTEVDHYQLQRSIDIYVAPTGEDIGGPQREIAKIIAHTQIPPNTRVDVRGLVLTMQSSFKSFGLGLFLAVLLVYLILVAQFSSFVDPFLIVLAVPTGLDWRRPHAGAHRHHAEHPVAHGRGDAAGHGGLQQHFDCGFRERAAQPRPQPARGGGARLPHPAATDSDDVARHRRRLAAHGFQAGNRQRSLRAAGSRDHRRPADFHRAHHFRGSRGLSADVPPPRRSCRVARHRGGSLMRRRYLCTSLLLIATALAGTPACAQLHAAVGKQAPAQAVASRRGLAKPHAATGRANRASESPAGSSLRRIWRQSRRRKSPKRARTTILTPTAASPE